MTTQRELSPDASNLSPELVPVVESGAQGLPQAAGSGSDELVLGDLLADALFGEVIDISDLIPRMLSPSGAAETAAPGVDVLGMPQSSLGAGEDVLVAVGHHGAALTILYDDDILVSDKTIL